MYVFMNQLNIYILNIPLLYNKKISIKIFKLLKF